MPTVYNKVTANGQTLIDLSNDTVTSADHIVAGYVGHLADGTQVTGTGSGGGCTVVGDPLGYYYDSQLGGNVIVVGGNTVMTEETVSTDGDVSKALNVNKICHFLGDLDSLMITLTATDYLPQYHFDFYSGATAPTLTMPNTVVMPDNFSVLANRHYEVSILNNNASVSSWSHTATSRTVDSVSATYTQSGTVYTTDSLDSLKRDLVVTKVYDDTSTVPVSDSEYTLSGTLSAGTSTVTVTVVTATHTGTGTDSLTTTFTVTVTAAPSE